MIDKFGTDTALLVIDAQVGVDVLEYWGGPSGRRNNPAAETNLHRLLDTWRHHGLRVAFTRHNSRQCGSPLSLRLPSGAQKPGFEIGPDEIVVTKDVNSGFIGTSLEVQLRRAGTHRLVIAGFFTNMCVETTARMAGNLGFDTYVVHDACATTNRLDAQGADRDPELLHAVTMTNLHGEFATCIAAEDAVELATADVARLDRRQGNE